MENKGTVYFFTGLSGAGKTTLGSLFYRRLKAHKPNVVILDGDQTRPVFNEELGYSAEDRFNGAKRVFRVCKMLADQNIDVVCCSICMFEEVRAWNRATSKIIGKFMSGLQRIRCSPATRRGCIPLDGMW